MALWGHHSSLLKEKHFCLCIKFFTLLFGPLFSRFFLTDFWIFLRSHEMGQSAKKKRWDQVWNEKKTLWSILTFWIFLLLILILRCVRRKWSLNVFFNVLILSEQSHKLNYIKNIFYPKMYLFIFLLKMTMQNKRM